MLAAEISLCGKAVTAVQIAGVGNQKTERLDDSIALFEVKCLVRIGLPGKKLALPAQDRDILQGLLHLLLSDALRRKLLQKLTSDLVVAFAPSALIDQADRLIGERIRHMDTSAVDIKNNVVTIEFVLMNHIVLLCFQIIKSVLYYCLCCSSFKTSRTPIGQADAGAASQCNLLMNAQ